MPKVAVIFCEILFFLCTIFAEYICILQIKMKERSWIKEYIGNEYIIWCCQFCLFIVEVILMCLRQRCK